MVSLQFWLTMSYLAKMTEEQTLVMYSGHPLGLFPSSPGAPRLIITNGMVGPSGGHRTCQGWHSGLGHRSWYARGWEESLVTWFPCKPSTSACCLPPFQVIPNYSSRADYEKLFALGVTM